MELDVETIQFGMENGHEFYGPGDRHLATWAAVNGDEPTVDDLKLILEDAKAALAS